MDPPIQTTKNGAPCPNKMPYVSNNPIKKAAIIDNIGLILSPKKMAVDQIPALRSSFLS